MPLATLFTADQIRARVAELAAEIRGAYGPEEEVHLVGVLKGAIVFLADLARAIPGPVSFDFVAVSSYADRTSSSGEVRLLKDVEAPLAGRHVLLVEDIVDTGLTVGYLQQLFRARRPKSLRTVCLLSKPARRRLDVSVEYVGFVVDDCFVVGYGLDYGGRYRNLPGLAALAPDAPKAPSQP